ncbi:unnamed protein product [Closterium sp. NIES-65]|nr:unnamed protein product [Closterium sp. NIES-65]
MPPSTYLATALKELTLENARVSLPEEFGQLTALENLCLVKLSQLGSLPASLGNLTSLKELKIEDCSLLAQLPDSITTSLRGPLPGNLTSLKELSLYFLPHLPALPASLPSIDHTLTSLWVSKCKRIKTLTEQIGRLGSLKKLGLSELPKLKSLPRSLLQLQRLEFLQVSNCSTLDSVFGDEHPGAAGHDLGEGSACLNLGGGSEEGDKCVLFPLLQGLTFDALPLQLLTPSVGSFSLQLCFLENIGVSCFPDDFWKLSSLSALTLTKAPNLCSLPRNSSQLAKLEDLDLESCKRLAHLPTGLRQMAKLLACVIFDCPLLSARQKVVICEQEDGGGTDMEGEAEGNKGEEERSEGEGSEREERDVSEWEESEGEEGEVREGEGTANFTGFAAEAPGGAELAFVDATLSGAPAELAFDPDFIAKPGAFLGKPEAADGQEIKDGSAVRGIVTGAIVGSFEDVRFKSEEKEKEKAKAERGVKELQVVGLGDAESLQRDVFEAERLAAGIILTKQLVNAPPNVLTPAVLADVAVNLTAAHADVLNARILEKDECAALGMGSYLAVAEASAADNPPKFIHVTYTPPAAADAGQTSAKSPVHASLFLRCLSPMPLIVPSTVPHLPLLTFPSSPSPIAPINSSGGHERRQAAKGSTIHLIEFFFVPTLPHRFPPIAPTSGGYNLKAGPGSTIHLMKFDMGGAAAVLGAANAIAAIQPQGVQVHFIIAACENMVSGGGMKLGDIITASNGKTIEVNNTDAEGRLTLADALLYAQQQGVEKIVDVATLTGACIIALGNDIAGTPLLCISGTCFPNIAEEAYWEGMRSKHADMLNTGGREGGSITAALFLKQFVAEGLPWAHLDIAGPVWSEKKGGGTGFGASLLYHWVASHSP